MKIHKVKLKNYKSFVEKEFSFNPSITILVGDNGTGKSAILDALAIALGSFLEGVDEVKTRLIHEDEIRRKDFGEHIERQLPTKVEAEANLEGESINWCRSVEHASGKNTQEGILSILNKAKKLSKDVREGKEVTLPVIAYFGTGRLWLNRQATTKTQGKGSRLELGYKDCLQPNVNNKAFLQWMKTYELSIVQKNKKASVLNAVKAAISKCVDEWENVYYDFEEEDLVGYKIEKNSRERLPFRMLSDGVRNMIGLVAEVAYRCVVLNPHLSEKAILETPGVVLIDELDLHLHPSWQKRVVGDLKATFPRVQFVCSTHSPFIVQSLESDELINLDRPTDLNLQNLGIEEISEGVMGIAHKKSKAFTDMEEVAARYFELVNEGRSTEDSEELQRIKNELDEMLIPFSEDPAFTAQLKMERLAKLGM